MGTNRNYVQINSPRQNHRLPPFNHHHARTDDGRELAGGEDQRGEKEKRVKGLVAQGSAHPLQALQPVLWGRTGAHREPNENKPRRQHTMSTRGGVCAEERQQGPVQWRGGKKKDVRPFLWKAALPKTTHLPPGWEPLLLPLRASWAAYTQKIHRSSHSGPGPHRFQERSTATHHVFGLTKEKHTEGEKIAASIATAAEWCGGHGFGLPLCRAPSDRVPVSSRPARRWFVLQVVGKQKKAVKGKKGGKKKT
jgi:hypothetical protein